MRRLAAAGVLCIALASCSSGGSPPANLQTKMNAVTDAANAKDPAALRTAVGLFLQEVSAQSQNGDITSTKAQDLRVVAERVLADAALFEQPVAVPSPSSEPSPSPLPSPQPSPSPPAVSPSPEPPPPPLGVPSVGGSPSPQPSPS